MIHEESVYDMQVGKGKELIDAYANEGPISLKRNLGELVGFWSVDLGGSIDQLIQIWAFESDDDRRARREALWQDPEWVDFTGRFGDLIPRRQMRILIPAPLSPLK